MKKLFTAIIGCMSLHLALPLHVYAQTVKTFNVKVMDAARQTPIEGATVRLVGKETYERISNAEGMAIFQIAVPATQRDFTIQVTIGTLGFRKYAAFSKYLPLESQDTYNIIAALQSSELRFTVTVLSELDGKPINKAKVSINTPEGVFRETTNNSGVAVIDVMQAGRFKFVHVDATKDGYTSSGETIDMIKDKANFAVTLTLEPRPKVKLLRVMVTDDKQVPVQDAWVMASADGVPPIPGEATDETGMATIVTDSAGTFNVTVKHSNFETAENQIEINKFGDQVTYFLAFSLIRKANTGNRIQRPLKVAVLDEKTRKGIAGAQVNTSEGSILTDKYGVAYFKKVVALGENGLVQVTANGYQFAEQGFIGGGETYRYAPPSEDEVRFYLKKASPQQVKLIVQVIDYNTQRPVGKATVTVKNKMGKVLPTSGPTNAKGETTVQLKAEELANAPLRVQAKAAGYAENWSDVTAELLNLGYDPTVFTINIKQAKAAGVANEKKYGPFLVSSGEWHNTGIAFKKGDYFRVEANGAFTAKDGQKIGPEGGGYWTWWTLAGQIGKQRLLLSRGGGGTATEDGMLELGTPRGLGSKEFVKEDVENLKGNLTVFVYSKNGMWDKSVNEKNVEQDMQFLKRLLRKDPTLWETRAPDEILQTYRSVIAIHQLPNIKKMVDGEYVSCEEIVPLTILSNYTNIVMAQACRDCLNDFIKIMETRASSHKPAQ